MAERGSMEGDRKPASQKELVEYIARSLALDADGVSVSEGYGERGKVVSLKVSESDIGKVIGKYGRIAKAIRTVMAAASGADKEHCLLDIAD